MKKLIAVAIIAFSLTGCATGTGWQDNVARVVSQVTYYTQQACGFVPLAQTITAILAAGQFTEPFAIANAICAAVTKQGGRYRGVPRVSGVPVQGRFVR